MSEWGPSGLLRVTYGTAGRGPELYESLVRPGWEGMNSLGQATLSLVLSFGRIKGQRALVHRVVRGAQPLLFQQLLKL